MMNTTYAPAVTNSGLTQSNTSYHNNKYTTGQFNFERVNNQIKPYTLALLRRVLSSGKIEGKEYVALNPTRVDQYLGSFRFNLHSHRWQDFATGDKGGDFISLWAYVRGIKQSEAARELLAIVGGAQ